MGTATYGYRSRLGYAGLNPLKDSKLNAAVFVYQFTLHCMGYIVNV